MKKRQTVQYIHKHRATKVQSSKVQSRKRAEQPSAERQSAEQQSAEQQKCRAAEEKLHLVHSARAAQQHRAHAHNRAHNAHSTSTHPRTQQVNTPPHTTIPSNTPLRAAIFCSRCSLAPLEPRSATLQLGSWQRWRATQQLAQRRMRRAWQPAQSLRPRTQPHTSAWANA